MPSFKTLHIALVGGGTGGHLYPLLAIAEELQAAPTPSVVTYIGPNTEYDKTFREFGVTTYHIFSSKLRRYTTLSNFLDFFKFIAAFIKALFLLYFLMPDVVFVKGGPGSLSVALATKFYFIKIIVHESDAFPSLTTRLLERGAHAVLTSFPGTESFLRNKSAKCVGNPVRVRLFADTTEDKNTMKSALGFNPSSPLILVIGGSQGAQFLNSFIIDNLDEIKKHAQILHQTGKSNFKAIDHQFREFFTHPENRSYYQIRPYLENGSLHDALAAADIVVTRAGSSMLFEIALMKVPAIVVPISESANNHQRQNANHYETAGAGIVLEEQNLKINLFLNQLDKLISNHDLRESMTKACEAFSSPNAAKDIASLLLEVQT